MTDHIDRSEKVAHLDDVLARIMELLQKCAAGKQVLNIAEVTLLAAQAHTATAQATVSLVEQGREQGAAIDALTDRVAELVEQQKLANVIAAYGAEVLYGSVSYGAERYINRELSHILGKDVGYPSSKEPEDAPAEVDAAAPATE